MFRMEKEGRKEGLGLGRKEGKVTMGKEGRKELVRLGSGEKKESYRKD